MTVRSVPYGQIDTIFLDAGNTLASMDFEWISEELRARGVECDALAVRRAEAAARPAVNEALSRLGSTEGTDTFAFYLRSITRRIETPRPLPARRLRKLVDDLVPVLRSGGASRLWSAPVPGAREGVEAIRRLGLKLVVVSNSDGTCEQTLRGQGLLPYLDAVVDSFRIGFEKPDRRIFERALELCGSAPERTLHVGDMYAVDVEGAWGAGLHALLLDPYGDWPDVPCERAPDLPAIHRRFAARTGPG